jgi:hypothetical protein
MEPVLADEKAVAAFAEDAVVCVRQVLSTQEAAAAAIDAVLASPGPLAQVASGAGDPGAFSEDFCRWREIPQLGQLARQSRVPAVAAPLAHLTALSTPCRPSCPPGLPWTICCSPWSGRPDPARDSRLRSSWSTCVFSKSRRTR